jgi:hypothetical protein
MIKDIQLPIVEALLGVLTTLTSADSHSVARQILSQIRWLDFVFDGAAIAQLLIDCLPVLPDHVKLDVIAAAPEIVDDANHPVCELCFFLVVTFFFGILFSIHFSDCGQILC